MLLRFRRQIAWVSLRQFSVTAKFLHAGANGREIVGSTRPVHVASRSLPFA
jgi:hypothetical protein